MERLFKFLGALLLLGSLAAGWVWIEYQIFTEKPLAVGEEGMTLVIEPGASFRGVARELAARGALEKPHYLSWLARWSGQAQAIKAGEYRIEAGTTPPQLLDLLVSGRVVHYSLTLVEGWTFRQVMAAVRASEYLKHTLKGLEGAAVMARLGYPDQHPEGRFYPDTYHFPRGTRDTDFLRRAYQAMEERLAAEWADRAEGLPFDSPYEALTLASIVEKETAVPDERARIAGVFVRRLEKGMRLQTDPTIIYGLGAGFDGNLTRAHLRDAGNPYNTYRHSGLPPTPIAMPGGDAIHATLHPAEGNELYFVARGDGSHHFSATLREHNNAVIKYQLKGRNRSFSSNP